MQNYTNTIFYCFTNFWEIFSPLFISIEIMYMAGTSCLTYSVTLPSSIAVEATLSRSSFVNKGGFFLDEVLGGWGSGSTKVEVDMILLQVIFKFEEGYNNCEHEYNYSTVMCAYLHIRCRWRRGSMTSLSSFHVANTPRCICIKCTLQGQHAKQMASPFRHLRQDDDTRRWRRD